MDLTVVSSRKMGLYLRFTTARMKRMSDDVSPYAVSQSGMSPVSPPDLPPAAPTQVPKVFGIIHLCYAVLGALVSFAGVAVMFGMKMMVDNLGDEMKEVKPLLDAYQGMEVYIYSDVAVKLLMAVILFIAGVGLLKRKPWAIKLSVFWSIARIMAAIGMMIWGLSVSAGFQERLGTVQDAQQEQIQQLSQGVGNIMGIVMICIYPIVSLIFLSKKNVKDALR